MSFPTKSLLSNPHTVEQTLFIARMFDGFWDRWIAHGVEKKSLIKIRPRFVSLEGWKSGWLQLAEQRFHEAEAARKGGDLLKAENLYRLSSLYYQLLQWIYPKVCKEKEKWLQKSVEVMEYADAVSKYEVVYDCLKVENKYCIGRIRKPDHPIGCVIMLNPIDSAKEELYSYEQDFVKRGFVIFNFDGPGQGETYLFQKLKATKKRWEQYVNNVIEYASSLYPNLPIYLFGTSSGGAWVIYGTSHQNVTAASSVSPAIIDDTIAFPDYFLERMSQVLEGEDEFLPYLNQLDLKKPILLFHGGQDSMVSIPAMNNLYSQLPTGKKMVVYEEEGHCCNFKLPEVRRLSMDWFLESEGRVYDI